MRTHLARLRTAVVPPARESMPDVAQNAPAVPLVAREAELSSLRDAWAAARAGDSSAVLVAGEAGVGKTRLVSEFAAEAAADGAMVLIGHCVGLGQAAPPYLPVIEILSQLRARAPQAVAEPVADLLENNPAADQGRLFEAVRAALTAQAAQAPLLLVVEDLQWSDASTRDLLLFVLSRLGGGRLLLVLTYRSDDLHRQHPLRPMLATLARAHRVDRLDVAPFPPAQALDLARALAGSETPDEALVADVAERAQGNAFFTEELMSAAGSDARAGLSDALTSVLLDRIEKLGPTAQRVVRAAAIVGQRDIAEAALAALLGIGVTELEPALRECVQSHVLVVTAAGGYEFRHALLREAVYADLLPGERSRLHVSYLAVLGTQQPPGWRAAQAFHATRAGDLATAFDAHVAAAQEAQTMAAHGDALVHLEQALSMRSAATDPDQRGQAEEIALVILASDAAAASGRGERAIAFARSAVELADADGDVLVRADVRRRLAKLSYGEGDWREAERLIVQAWALLEDEPATPERAWVLSTLSFGEAQQDRRQFAERALADARAVGAGGAEADALISLSYIDLSEGDAVHAQESLDLARRRAQESSSHETELRAWFNIAVAQHDLGLLDQAAATLDDALQVAHRHGRRWSTYGRELVWLAQMTDHARGRWRAMVSRSRTWLPGAIGSARTLLLATQALAQVGLGETDAADRSLADLRRPGGDPPSVLGRDEMLRIAGWATVEGLLWRGRTEDALALLEQALAEPAWENDLTEIRVGALRAAAYADLAARARRTGGDASAQVAGALAAVERVEVVMAEGAPRAAEMGPEGRMWRARARAEAARAGAPGSDVDGWREVAELAAVGFRPHEALARWRLAEALLAAGDPVAAEPELRQALAIAVDLGYAPVETAIGSTARRYRVALPGVRTAGVDPLTPRERSVLELVAQGMTNRAVGSQLFISEKTVSVHLSRVMAKLGAKRRTEAVAVALGRGILDAR